MLPAEGVAELLIKTLFAPTETKQPANKLSAEMQFVKVVSVWVAHKLLPTIWVLQKLQVLLFSPPIIVDIALEFVLFWPPPIVA